jgi:hypothetical protein
MGALCAHVPGEGATELIVRPVPLTGSRKRDPTSPQRGEVTEPPQYRWLIGSSSAGNSVMTRQPVSVTTTSSSMRAAE